MDTISKIKFDQNGLVPAIIQDYQTKEVLMLAYMNKESLEKTIETKKTWFYSRSRKSLWNKGETSGNIQEVIELFYDCDADSLLIKVKQTGAACHTGEYSCFFNPVIATSQKNKLSLASLYNLINERKSTPLEGSYTNYLFDMGIDKILKKVGEESAEVIIGAKNDSKEELIYEISDLVYHILVLMVEKDVHIKDIIKELSKRHNNN